MHASSYRSVYDDIYSRRLCTPSICEVDASSAGNPVLPPRRCFTIISSNALNRWLHILRMGRNERQCGQRLLELGCGFGGLSCWIAEEMNCRVVGVDGCTIAVTVAQQINSHPNVEFINSDFDSLTRRIGRFDAVISLDALYQVADPSHTIATIRNVARKGAAIVFTVYCSQHGQTGARYQIGEWTALLRSAGLEPQHIHNVSGFWRMQMSRRHSMRIAKANDILASDGRKALPDLQVSHRIMESSGSRDSLLRSISRYDIVARNRGE